MGSKDDNLQLSTAERVSSMMTAKNSAEALRSSGTTAAERGPRSCVPRAEAEALLEDWPEAPRTVGTKLLEHYGPPHETTPTKFFWYRVGPWARMELTADEVIHDFPTPHTDFLTQYVDYPVDAARAGDVIAFDGSVVLDRNTGQIGARCDSEAANTLTLNVTVEILQGRRTVDDARAFLAESMAAYAMGRDAPYAERLQFTPVGGAADTDDPVIGQAVLDQLGEKLKDAVGKGEPPH